MVRWRREWKRNRKKNHISQSRRPPGRPTKKWFEAGRQDQLRRLGTINRLNYKSRRIVARLKKCFTWEQWSFIFLEDPQIDLLWDDSRMDVRIKLGAWVQLTTNWKKRQDSIQTKKMYYMRLVPENNEVDIVQNIFQQYQELTLSCKYSFLSVVNIHYIHTP